MDLYALSLSRIIIIIINFLIFLINFGLAVYVYKKGPKEKLNRAFAYLSGINGLWSLSNFWTSIVSDYSSIKLSYVVGTLLPFFTIFFIATLVNKKFSPIVKFFIIISAIFFSGICFTPLIVRQIYSYSIFNPKIETGLLFPLWGAYNIFFGLWCSFILLSSLFRVDEKTKRQIWYFLFGVVISIIWVATSGVILPLFGYSGVAGNIDSFGTIFFSIFTSYAIIKHNALGIKSFLFYAFVITSSIVLISAFLVLLLFLGSWFFNMIGVIGIVAIAIVSSILIVLIGSSFFKRTRDLEKAKIKLSALLEESEKNRTIAETEKDKTLATITNFSDGLLLLDTEEKISLINPMAQKYLHIRENELLGKPISALNESVDFKPLLSIFNKIKNINTKKEWMVHKDLEVEVSVVHIASQKGRVGSLIILHDITQKKVIERMKSDFVSLAAHQLRTPSTGIRWGVKALIDGGVGKVSVKQKEFLSKIYKTNERTIDLINSLLDINKIESGSYLSDLKQSNIESIASSAIEQFEEKAASKKIKIKLEISNKDIPLLLLDEEKVKIVFEIIIDNAINYTPNNGEVTVSLTKKGNEVEVQIADNGYGIPASEQSVIFSKFFRGSNIQKVNTEGTGLGLFTAKNIIDLHGGRIWFKSEEQKGTTFYFTLPVIRGNIVD